MTLRVANIAATAIPSTLTDLTVTNNLTLSAGTANGVLYLNGSKVVTSGSALTFDGTNLQIGTGTQANALQIGNRIGLDSAGTIYFGSALTGNSRGWLSWDTDLASINTPLTLQFRIASSEAMRLNSTGLGIGKTAAYKLDVNGAAALSNDGATVSLYMTAGMRHLASASNFYLDLSASGAAGSFIIRNSSSFTTQLTLDASGNLGLGVTPSAWNSGKKVLQFASGSIIATPTTAIEIGQNFFINAGGNSVYSTSSFATDYAQVNGQHIFYTAPSGTAGNNISFTQAMTLDASSRLLLGTTTRGLANNSNTVFSVAGGSTVYQSIRASGGQELYFQADGSASTLGVLAFSNNPLIFGTNNSERVRIPAEGGMLIGTGAIATNATDGFLYVPGCAGTPTGTPTTYGGRVPIVVDTTNYKLYFYAGGIWQDAGP